MLLIVDMFQVCEVFTYSLERFHKVMLPLAVYDVPSNAVGSMTITVNISVVLPDYVELCKQASTSGSDVSTMCVYVCTGTKCSVWMDFPRLNDSFSDHPLVQSLSSRSKRITTSTSHYVDCFAYVNCCNCKCCKYQSFCSIITPCSYVYCCLSSDQSVNVNLLQTIPHHRLMMTRSLPLTLLLVSRYHVQFQDAGEEYLRTPRPSSS